MTSPVVFLTGLKAEAKLLAPLGCPVETGGGTPEGAQAAAQRAVARGAGALVSFGLAGGLDPALRSGCVLRPAAVLWNGRRIETDPALMQALGGTDGRSVLCWSGPVATAAHKLALGRSSGAAAVDLESGPAAEIAVRHGLRFGVLRAIVDDAALDLPPAALDALDANGQIRLGQMMVRLLRRPGQMPALIGLGRHAARARAALAAEVASLARDPSALSGV